MRVFASLLIGFGMTVIALEVSAKDPPPLPYVNIVATVAEADEAGAVPAVFTFSRTNAPTYAALTVHCMLGGDAIRSMDYESITCDTVIPANETSATLTVYPLQDNLMEPDESLTVTLRPGNYHSGSMVTAEAIIVDDPPVVSVTASDSNAREGADSGAFTLQRTGGNPSDSLTVTVMYYGSASPYTDYLSAGTQLVFPQNATALVLPVVPILDPFPEGTELATIQLINNGRYAIVSPGVATVSILDPKP